MVRWEEKKELPSQDLEKKASAAGAHGRDSMERYDPNPQGCSAGSDQLVTALCKAFMDDSPQCSSKKK